MGHPTASMWPRSWARTRPGQPSPGRSPVADTSHRGRGLETGREDILGLSSLRLAAPRHLPQPLPQATVLVQGATVVRTDTRGLPAETHPQQCAVRDPGPEDLAAKTQMVGSLHWNPAPRGPVICYASPKGIHERASMASGFSVFRTWASHFPMHLSSQPSGGPPPLRLCPGGFCATPSY